MADLYLTERTNQSHDLVNLLRWLLKTRNKTPLLRRGHCIIYYRRYDWCSFS